jgi:type II secretory pathway pseudopilin PulG
VIENQNPQPKKSVMRLQPKTYNLKPINGFTLIEVGIVVFMTALITTITIAGFRNGQKQKLAGLASDTVINAIRNAQNFSLTGKNTNNSNATCRVPQYYFITFSYSSDPVLSAFNNCNTVDQIETYPMPANTRVKASGLVLDSNVAATNLIIAFYPPFATMKATRDNGTYGIFATANITVENSEGTVNKTIRVDGVSGRIGE